MGLVSLLGGIWDELGDGKMGFGCREKIRSLHGGSMIGNIAWGFLVGFGLAS
jgi:hypothetical protein